MNDTFSPLRSDAIRAELIDVVDRTPARRPRRLILGIGLVIAGVLAGGGATAATAGMWHPEPFFGLATPVTSPTANHGVPAPAGYLPGQPIVTLVGKAASYDVEGEERIIQLDAPAEATHVRVIVTCTSRGTTFWGFDAGGNNPSSECAASDIGTQSAAASMDFDLYDFSMFPQYDLLYIQPSPGATSIVTVQFLNEIGTQWKVNAAGEYCGVVRPGVGAPQLQAVYGTFLKDGVMVGGYVRESDLESSYPGEPAPTTPEQAGSQQERRQRDYPNGWDIPVYECDGVTQVGVFHIG